VRLAGGLLFTQPLDGTKGWQTKPALGAAHDIAFHPLGRFLSVVFADGSAKYLDRLNGTVQQSFKWSKKPLYSVAFSPDGLTCAAGGENGQVVVWDVDA
jgi:WD40 repeat protein